MAIEMCKKEESAVCVKPSFCCSRPRLSAAVKHVSCLVVYRNIALGTLQIFNLILCSTHPQRESRSTTVKIVISYCNVCTVHLPDQQTHNIHINNILYTVSTATCFDASALL